MNKEEAISFAGLMEEYLNIPSFVCEMIQQQLEENKYKEVIEYVIQRRNELESKENYKSYQDMIKMYLELQQRIGKAIEILKIIPITGFEEFDRKTDELYYVLKGE